MKKIFAVTLVLTLLLAGCGEETATESQLPTETIPQPTETTEALTQPTTIATEPPVETISLPDVLVSDARRETLNSNSAEIVCAVPKVNLSSKDAEAWNQAIYQEFEPAFAETSLPLTGGFDYTFWTSEDYLTIELMVKAQVSKFPSLRFAVFRLSDGSLVGNEELIADFAGPEAVPHLTEIIEKNWATYYDVSNAAVPEESSHCPQRANTLLWDNLRHVVLYPDMDGKLVSSGTMYHADNKIGSSAVVPILDYSWTEQPWKAPENATAESLVTVFREEHVSYTDTPGNQYDITMRIPQLQIPGVMAENCNTFFQTVLNSSVEEVLDASKEGFSSTLTKMDFKAWTWGRNLTLFVWSESSFGSTSYHVYTFDLDTGNILDNRSVAEELGLENWQEQMARTAGDYFDDNCGAGPDESLQKYQRSRTLSSQNLASASIFPDDTGAIKMLCNVYSVAGADSYWHCLDLAKANS